MTSALTVPAMLARTADRFESRPALIDASRRRSWGDVVADVERRTGALRSRGVGAGDAVGIVLGNDMEFVTTFLAVVSAGAVAVPLNPLLTVAELGLYLRDRSVAGLITSASRVPAIGNWAAAAGSGAWVADVVGFDAARDVGRSHVDVCTPEMPALHAFSSGSTGTPKGIVRTQANLTHEADHFFDTVGVSEDDVILTAVALFHAHGLGNCVLAAARSGAAMVLLDPFQRDAALEAIARDGVTVFPTVPFVVQTLAETRRADRAAAGSLRLCFTAGAPLARETFDLFTARFGVPVRQLYGCSEAGSVTMNLDEDPSPSAASVGRPMKGIEVAIVGEQGVSRPPGSTGEVTFTSPALTSGYVGVAPEANEAFRDGWFRTGDLGHVDESGNLFVTGRTKLFISTGGYKVDPVEVENVLRRHPGVADVVVVGAAGSLGEEIVKAVVVPAESTADEAALRGELIGLCRTRLAVYKVPRIVEFRSEIPRSPLGKILRKYLV
ncbi:MAG: class I adenylate-forming enzyme family protein [Jiangellaceae bacterium]